MKKNRIKVNWKVSSRVTVANILRTVTIYLFDFYKNNLEEMLHMIKLRW